MAVYAVRILLQQHHYAAMRKTAGTVKRDIIMSLRKTHTSEFNTSLYEITTELEYMTNYCSVTYTKNILYIKTEYHLHTIGHIFTTNSVQHTPCTKHNISLTSFYKLKFRLEFTVLRIMANKPDRTVLYTAQRTHSSTLVARMEPIITFVIHTS